MKLITKGFILSLLTILMAIPALAQKEHKFFKKNITENTSTSKVDKIKNIIMRHGVVAHTSSHAARPTDIKSRLIALSSYEAEDFLNPVLELEDSLRLFWADGVGQENLAEISIAEEMFFPGYSVYFDAPDINLKVDSILYIDVESGGYELRLFADKDAQGNILSHTIQEFDEEDGWENEYKMEYTYTQNGLLATVTTLWHDGDNWMNEEQVSYDYDAQGKLIEEVSSYWDWNLFEPRYSYTNEYDSKGRLHIQTRKSWAGGIEPWEIEERSLATYENDLLISEHTEYFYGEGEDDFVIDEKMLLLYDNEGKYIGMEAYEEDEGMVASAEYVYEGENIVEVFLTVYDNDEPYMDLRYNCEYNEFNQITYFNPEIWLDDELGWIPINDVQKFYYEEYESSTSSQKISTKDQLEFNLFPNPAKEFVTISLPQQDIDIVRIYNQSGEVILMQEVSAHTRNLQIKLEDINTGIYLLEVESDRKKGVKMFIIQ